jgi:chemotaxis protein histidine kinase CheA
MRAGARQRLEEHFDFELIEEFLEHFGMMAELIEPLVYKLEVPQYYEKSIHELFRIFHNLKSASSFLKIEVLTRFTAFVEEFLSHLCYKDGPASEEVITWLLGVSDRVIDWYEDIKLDREFSKIDFSLIKLPDMGHS